MNYKSRKRLNIQLIPVFRRSTRRIQLLSLREFVCVYLLFLWNITLDTFAFMIAGKDKNGKKIKSV